MFLLAHRLLRGMVLGLMCFLAGTASCSCDSYDPDPYDDLPPVVTVDFNYVVPSGVTLRRPGTQVTHPQQAPSPSHASRVTTVSVLALASPLPPMVRQDTLHLVMPLRC
jgi:hypothetical protein